MTEWGLDRIAKVIGAIGAVGSVAIFGNQQFERLNSLASVQETTNAQLETLQSRLDGLAVPESPPDVATKKEVETITRTTASLATSLSRLEKQGEQVADFETRVAAVEQKISSLAPGTGAGDGGIAAEVDALSKAMSELSSQGGLKLKSLVGRIETLETGFAKLGETNGRLERLDQKISDLEGRIETALRAQSAGGAGGAQDAPAAKTNHDLTGQWRGNITCDSKKNYTVLFSIDTQTGESASGKFDRSGDLRMKINATLAPPSGRRQFLRL